MITNPEQELIDALIRVLLKGTSVESTPVDIGHGVLISASELHFLFLVNVPKHELFQDPYLQNSSHSF